MRDIVSRFRYKAAQWLYRTFLGPVGGTLPWGGIRSLQEVMYQKEIRQHVREIVELTPPEINEFSFPKSFPPWFRREKTFDRRNLYELSDLYVSPRSGLVWLPNGLVVEESLGSLRRIMGWQGATKDALLSTKSLEIENSTVVCASQGYFHWIFEELPRVLYAVDYEPSSRLLLHEDTPSYVIESLRRCVGAKYVSDAIRVDCPVRVPSLILPAANPYSGFVPVRDIKLLRDSTLGREDTSRFLEESGPNILYVSRRGASRRSMTKEKELEGELQRCGVEVIRAETLPFDEQVRRFREADLVVAPHGAGLSNIVWARDAELLEIFPCSWFNDCYARITRSLGFEYNYLRGRRDGTTYGEMPISQILDFVEDWRKKREFV